MVILHRDYPLTLWLTRNGSPLLLGMNTENSSVVIASEHSAFGSFVDTYIALNNHDVFEITKDYTGIIQYNQTIHQYETRVHHHEQVLLEPEGFDNWMLKEIHEQPNSIARALNNGGRLLNDTCVRLGGLDSHKTKLRCTQHLMLLGCGTSYHAALWSSHWFKYLEMFETVTVHDGGEFDCLDIPRNGNVVCILVSQSGETLDLYRCIKLVRDKNIISIGVVNTVDSMIARETDCGVYLNAGNEIAVGSTKSFSSQCVVLTLIAVWFSQHKHTNGEKRCKIIEDLRNISFQMKMLLQQYTEQALKEYIDLMQDKENMFVLGKGLAYSIALEGALKLKEISYIHAEAFSSSALKHGPLSLIVENTPVFILDIENEYRVKNWNCYEEISARNGNVIYVTNDPLLHVQCIRLEHNNTFGGLLTNTVLQLLSYYIGVRRGNCVDFPRNLAKSVTVY